jgi:phage/plasmid-like protein (TIGR03299 family)
MSLLVFTPSHYPPMPDAIANIDGHAAMMYVGKRPWHGLGTALDDPPTSAEAIEAAGLDWKVSKKSLFACDEKSVLAVPDRYAVVRDEQWGNPDCPVFGIVGKHYTPLQNKDAFEFFDPIVNGGRATYETAGALGQGEKVWILAKLPGEMRVGRHDVVEKYLLLSNSHDGASSVQVKFTPIRVVCQNTLTMALRDGPTIRVMHSRDLPERLRAAQKALGLIDSHFGRLGDSFQEMARVQLASANLHRYLTLVFPNPADHADERGIKRAIRDRAACEFLFEHGAGNSEKGVAGSLWAGYNAVTEYIDHGRSRPVGDRRLESIWFGDGYLVKARAYRLAQLSSRAWLN